MNYYALFAWATIMALAQTYGPFRSKTFNIAGILTVIFLMWMFVEDALPGDWRWHAFLSINAVIALYMCFCIAIGSDPAQMHAVMRWAGKRNPLKKLEDKYLNDD